MRNVFLSTVVGATLLAGSAFAGDVLSDRDLDTISAGADITTIQLAQATTAFDITTNDDHDVTVEAQDVTALTVTVVADTSVVGTGLAQSSLATSTTNN